MFFYEKTTIFAQLAQNNASWNALCVERGLLHLNISIVYSKVLHTFDNFDKPM